MFGVKFGAVKNGASRPLFASSLFGAHVAGASDFSRANSESPLPAADLKKFGVAPDPITREVEMGELVPTPAWLQHATGMAQKHWKSNASKVERDVARRVDAKRKYESLEQEQRENFYHDFNNWVLGLGQKGDYERAGVKEYGQGKLLSRHPQVVDYFEAKIDRQATYNAYIAKMRARGPGVGREGGQADMYDLWLYWKYIVRLLPLKESDFWFLNEGTPGEEVKEKWKLDSAKQQWLDKKAGTYAHINEPGEESESDEEMARPGDAGAARASDDRVAKVIGTKLDKLIEVMTEKSKTTTATDLGKPPPVPTADLIAERDRMLKRLAELEERSKRDKEEYAKKEELKAQEEKRRKAEKHKKKEEEARAKETESKKKDDEIWESFRLARAEADKLTEQLGGKDALIEAAKKKAESERLEKEKLAAASKSKDAALEAEKKKAESERLERAKKEEELRKITERMTKEKADLEASEAKKRAAKEKENKELSQAYEKTQRELETVKMRLEDELSRMTSVREEGEKARGALKKTEEERARDAEQIKKLKGELKYTDEQRRMIAGKLASTRDEMAKRETAFEKLEKTSKEQKKALEAEAAKAREESKALAEKLLADKAQYEDHTRRLNEEFYNRQKAAQQEQQKASEIINQLEARNRTTEGAAAKAYEMALKAEETAIAYAEQARQMTQHMEDLRGSMAALQVAHSVDRQNLIAEFERRHAQQRAQYEAELATALQNNDLAKAAELREQQAALLSAATDEHNRILADYNRLWADREAAMKQQAEDYANLANNNYNAYMAAILRQQELEEAARRRTQRDDVEMYDVPAAAAAPKKSKLGDKIKGAMGADLRKLAEHGTPLPESFSPHQTHYAISLLHRGPEKQRKILLQAGVQQAHHAKVLEGLSQLYADQAPEDDDGRPFTFAVDAAHRFSNYVNGALAHQQRGVAESLWLPKAIEELRKDPVFRVESNEKLQEIAQAAWGKAANDLPPRHLRNVIKIIKNRLKNHAVREFVQHKNQLAV